MASPLVRTAAALAVASLPLIAGATAAQAGDDGRDSYKRTDWCKKPSGEHRQIASRDGRCGNDEKPPWKDNYPKPEPRHEHRGDHHDYDRTKHDDYNQDHRRHDDTKYGDHRYDQHHKKYDDSRYDHKRHDKRHHHKRHDHRVTYDPYNVARTATAGFFSVAAAERAGYARPASGPLRACISQDPKSQGSPAMGFHWINNALLMDGKVDASKPEALVYEPNKDGKLDFVAVEYVVFKADWEKAGNLKPPKLFDTEFMLTTSPNRYGSPAFYSLHAWIWKSNPDGINAPFNVRVSCQYSSLLPK